MPANSLPKRPRFLAQEKPNTCAVACLRMVLSSYGVDIPEIELAQLTKTDEFGTALENLVQAAEALGFSSKASIVALDSLGKTQYPIVYLDGPTLGRNFLMHAVVVEELHDQVKLLDPAQGEILLPRDKFREAWELAGSYAIVLQPHQTKNP